jgi:hypothetical protein
VGAPASNPAAMTVTRTSSPSASSMSAHALGDEVARHGHRRRLRRWRASPVRRVETRRPAPVEPPARSAASRQPAPQQSRRARRSSSDRSPPPQPAADAPRTVVFRDDLDVPTS